MSSAVKVSLKSSPSPMSDETGFALRTFKGPRLSSSIVPAVRCARGLEREAVVHLDEFPMPIHASIQQAVDSAIRRASI